MNTASVTAEYECPLRTCAGDEVTIEYRVIYDIRGQKQTSIVNDVQCTTCGTSFWQQSMTPLVDQHRPSLSDFD